MSESVISEIRKQKKIIELNNLIRNQARTKENIKTSIHTFLIFKN